MVQAIYGSTRFCTSLSSKMPKRTRSSHSEDLECPMFFLGVTPGVETEGEGVTRATSRVTMTLSVVPHTTKNDAVVYSSSLAAWYWMESIISTLTLYYQSVQVRPRSSKQSRPTHDFLS